MCRMPGLPVRIICISDGSNGEKARSQKQLFTVMTLWVRVNGFGKLSLSDFVKLYCVYL